MGFSLDPKSKKARQKADLPFFQELDIFGKPTGVPLRYDTLLVEVLEGRH